MSSQRYRGIWVFAEQRHGQIKNVAYELLAKGRGLADILNTELSAVCFGHGIDEVDRLIAHGADKVYLAESPELADNQEDFFTQQLVGLIQEHRPEIVLAGATALGRAFIPRVAAALPTGLSADCIDLEVDAEKRLLLQTKPTFGGNIMAVITCPEARPQMATVRPHVFSMGEPDSRRKGEIIKRKARAVFIYDIKVDSLTEDELKISVECGTGTYIRTLAEDIGKALGCGSAYLIGLRRSAVGDFDLSKSQMLKAIEDMNMEEDEGVL